MSGILKSIAIWLGASGLAVVVGFLVVRMLSPALLAVFFASPPASLLITFSLMLGGPAAILIVGINRRRLSMIIGPLLLIPIAVIWMTGGDWIDASAKAKHIAELDARTFSAPVAQHRLIVLEYSGRNDCDQLCQLILVSSNHSVAVGGSASDLTVYREISHDECLETQYVRHNVRFFGICATAEPIRQIDDALLIETPLNLGAWDIFPDVDHEFHGAAFALVERLQGQDRLLGRWISGQVRSGSYESNPIGQAFTREEFYRVTLGMRLDIRDLQNATWLWQGL